VDEERRLHAAVIAVPRDDAPRLACADWYDANGSPRGEFIRAQLEVTNVRRRGGSMRAWSGAAAVARRWLDDFPLVLAAPLAPFVDAKLIRDPIHIRGWHESIEIDGAAFVEYADALCRAAPILHLRVTGGGEAVRALAVAPVLGRFVSLGLRHQQLTDDDVIALARSPYLESLGWLDLAGNQLGRPALDALADARAPRLGYVNWSQNAIDDPVDTMHVDGGEVLDAWPTRLGQELEAKHGALPWLHAPWRFRFGYPPFPDAFE
jgi:uncharacterized protein (TIGR02996 family)